MNVAQRRRISLAFLVIVIVFLGIYLAGIDYTKVARLTINWPLLMLATFTAILFRYWGVFIWRVVLRELGTASLPRFSILSSIYSKAWMGRYVPGKVTWIAGRIYFGSGLGITKSRLTVSAFLEGGMQIVALLAVSLLLLGLDPRLDVIGAGPKWVMVAIAGLCLAALTPGIFNFLVRKLYLLVKKGEPGPELKITRSAAFKSFSLYAIGAILSGTSFYLLVRAVDPGTSVSIFVYCIGAYNLAGAVGMATPILPSGIGVRDGVLLILLTVVFPAEIAVALTVFSRVWSVIVDVCFYLVSTITSRVLAVSVEQPPA